MPERTSAFLFNSRIGSEAMFAVHLLGIMCRPHCAVPRADLCGQEPKRQRCFSAEPSKHHIRPQGGGQRRIGKREPTQTRENHEKADYARSDFRVQSQVADQEAIEPKTNEADIVDS